MFFFFFFNDTATTEIYTLSLHDALPISRRPLSRRDRGSLYRRPRDRRHLCIRRRSGALRGAGRRPCLCLARQRQGCQSSVLCGRKISAVDLSRRTGAQAARRPPCVERAAGTGARLAVLATGFFARARRERTAVGKLSARQQALACLLPLRGAAGASDARHAADAAYGTGTGAAARFRR